MRMMPLVMVIVLKIIWKNDKSSDPSLIRFRSQRGGGNRAGKLKPILSLLKKVEVLMSCERMVLEVEGREVEVEEDLLSAHSRLSLIIL